MRAMSMLATILAMPAFMASAQVFPPPVPANQAQELRLDKQSRVRVADPKLPAGVTVRRGIAYGTNPAQRFDVYIPAGATKAPIIFMVHGGGWRRGDKAMGNTVTNKVARWAPKGFIVVSANYPMTPEAKALEQAKYVAGAIAAVQRLAPGWGGDPAHMVLMGHSAGAHLVALINSSATMGPEAGAKPWLGTVSLDSGAMNVPQLMNKKHPSLYDEAFGADPAYWQAASPYHQLQQVRPPILLVCSSSRRESCAQSAAYVTRAAGLGSPAKGLPEKLSHGEINSQLGLPGAYTDAVEDFLKTLSPALAARL